MTTKTKLSLVASLLIATQTFGQSTQDLGTITVSSATKSEQSIKDVTSTVEVITSYELEAKHITTVTQALNQISGINYTSNGGLGKSTSLFLRGFDSKRTLVLIDGIRYNDATSASGAPFEHLMITDIEQIEIIKGAQSGIWGADASAGVINIITKKADKGTHGSILAEYGSFSTKKYGANIAHATKDFNVKASYQKVDSDGFSAYQANGTDLDSYEDDGYENDTANLKFGYNINAENKIEVSHTIINAEGEYDSFNADADSTTKTEDAFSNIRYENITDFSKNEVYVNRSTFDREYVSSSTSEFDGSVDEYGVNSNIPYGDGSDFVIVGFDYKKFEHLNSINKNFNNKAAFVTNSNIIDDKLVVTESLRADKYSAFDDKTTGKVGAKYNFEKDIYVSSNIGTAYNIPTLYQLYSVYGNASLKAENTKSIDASLGYKSTKVTYFYNTIEDMIDYSFSTSKYANIDGKSKIKGLEIDYKNNITRDILLSLNYTKLSAKNEDKETLRRRADQTLKFGIDYFGLPKFHFNLSGEYVGDRYDSDNKQGAQTGRYTVMNLVANYQVSKDIVTYVKVDNLTDKEYQVVNNYATSPRAAYAGVKVKF